jgi:hypothetical protein
MSQEQDDKQELENYYVATGVDKNDPTKITMQEGNIYVALMPHKSEEGTCGAAILSLDGGNTSMQLMAYGIFELLSTEPDLLIEAGHSFYERSQETDKVEQEGQ